MLKKRYTRCFAWALAGIIFSFSIGTMWTSGTWNLNCFFDVGQVYDFIDVEKSSCWYDAIPGENGWVPSNRNEDGWVLGAEDGVIGFLNLTNGAKGCWRYILMEVRNDIPNGMLSTIKTIKDGQIMSEQEVVVKNGVNVWHLGDNQFDKIQIEVHEQDVSFRVLNIQLWEQEPVYDVVMLLIRSIISLTMWILVSFIIVKYRRGKHLDWYYPIKQFQKIYCIIATKMYNYTSGLDAKKRSFIRRILFLIIIVFSNYMDTSIGWTKSYGWTFLVTLLGIFGISAVSIEKSPKLLDWRKPVIYSWFYYSLLAFVSEIIVERNMAYVGILLLGGFGLLYFVVGNMKDGLCMIEDIIQVLEFTFWVSTVYCIFCRPYKPSLNYLGPCFNSAVYAMYLLMILIIFMGRVLEQLGKNGKKINYIRYIVGIGICYEFLDLADSRNVNITVGLITVLFFWNIAIRKSVIWYQKCFWAFAGVAIILITGIGIKFAVQTVPEALGTTMTFERDAYQMGEKEKDTLVVEAAQVNKTYKEQMWKIWDRADRMSSYRLTFWKYYLREMNLWGHSNEKALVRLRRENPHNAYIGIAYRYGVVAVIPYVLMTISGIIVSLRQGEKSWRGFVLNGGWTAIIVVSMLDNVELPLRWLLWFLINLFLGCIFLCGEGEIEKGKK